MLTRFPWRSPRHFASLLLGSLICCLLLVLPLRAQEAFLSPRSPSLGDTLSVVVRADGSGSAPSVTFRQQAYPMFPLENSFSRRFRALLPTTPLDRPGPEQITLNTLAGSQTLQFTLRNRNFPLQRIWLPPGKDDEGSDFEFDQVDAFKTIVTPQKRWQGPFKRPATGSVTSVYGVRRYYNGVFAKDYFHRGVDYAGGVGAPVMAPAAGRIALVGRESQGFKIHGNTIGIDHGQGVLSIMIHLSRIDVRVGDEVKPGQVIGGIGDTGASAGPHLHWGLYVNGQSVDPVPWRETGFE